MATIGETLKRLRKNVIDCGEEDRLEPGYIPTFDRAVGDTLMELIDGTPAPAEPPKKRTYTRKPKTTPPVE